uniref:O-6-methylguanine DNA methyltransferase n=1 Tax=Candidatus Kentrum sp. TUN TaxID=2126343 RepID=A0A451A0I5_9GAMM|nr:MAG: O-6-methylguanine DNA methyltransferase [Candidatus Kentron sp. TUN]
MVSREGFLRKIELLPKGHRVNLRNSTHGNSQDSFTSGRSELSMSRYNYDSIIADIADQLGYYFKDPEWYFALPLAPDGTPFQQRVWRALQSIPPGKTISYGILAARLRTCARAVGNACRMNPIPIVIPCHRVVGARSLGGFIGSRVGEPIAIKQWLLTHEFEFLRNRRKKDSISHG